MALGGGTFTAQNKVLPGAYINFVSAAAASGTLSDRGVAAMPLALDWGPDGVIFEVDAEDLEKESLALFGRRAGDAELAGIRDVFKNAQRLCAYKLGTNGKKAANAYAEALYTGERGNALTIVIEEGAGGAYTVRTLLAGETVDEQTVTSAGALTANAFVTWKAGAALAATAGTPLTGGENGEADAASHEAFLRQLETCSFNTLGVVTADESVKKMYAAFTKRMRDEQGVKFQTVLYREAADHPGIVSVQNRALGEEEAALVYWVTGAEAGCAVNRSCQNKLYDGEFEIDTGYTQSELKEGIQAGQFLLHKVGRETRVLCDINSLVHETPELGEAFRENQTVRVVDQIANDIAVLFRDKYLGVVPNDAAGRVSLWTDIVRHHESLAQMRAIENFTDADVTVAAGETKKSVVVSDAVTVVNAMSKLYMTVTVA